MDAGPTLACASPDPHACRPLSELEHLILSSEPLRIPPRSPIDAVLDTQRGFTQSKSGFSDPTLREDTTANAIALSRASGIPFTAAEVTDRSAAAARASADFQFTIPHAAVILQALTLGIEPFHPTVYDDPYGRIFDASDASKVTHALPDGVTGSGLALLGAGIPLDPHALVSSQEVTQVEEGVGTPPGTNVAPGGLDLAAQASIAPIHDKLPIDLAFSTRSVRHDENASASRVVDIPASNALGAIALHDQGTPVDVGDIMNVQQQGARSVDEVATHFLSRSVLLYWLTLGLSSSPGSPLPSTPTSP